MAVATASVLAGGPAVRRPTAPAQVRTAQKSEKSALKRVFAVLVDELRPFEGRLGMSLRMAVSVMLVVAFMMSQQVPEAVLSCYLVFFASRKDAGAGMLIALALIVAVSIGIALGIVVMQFSADDSMVRLLLMAAFTFGGMFLSQATRLGSLGVTAGFVFVFALSLVDFLPYPKLISHGLSWIWVVVVVPMVVLFVVNALTGPNPAVLARKTVARRLSAAAALLSGDRNATTTARSLLAEKDGSVTQLTRMARVFSFMGRDEARRICGLAPRSRELLALAGAAGPDPVLAADLSDLARSIATHHTDRTPHRFRSTRPETAALAERAGLVARIWRGEADHDCPGAARLTLFLPDAFTNSAHWQFALKTVIAVFTTYAIYTAWDWFEIHTAMITCFYVALGSAGETLHKAALRIAGALIGGAMGIAAIVLLMPHMTDIGQLLVLAGIGGFIAAWVATGSELIRYMGWQMALAFFLCILPTITTSFVPNGFGPVFDTGVATNRVLGIIVGNAVVAFVFLSFWPVSVSESLAKALHEAIAPLRAALRGQPAALANVWPSLSQARRLSGLSQFEVSRLRFRSPIMPHVQTLLAATEEAATTLTDITVARSRPRFLFGAPRCAKAALHAHEKASGAFLDLAASSILMPVPEARTMLIAALQRSAETLGRFEHLTGRLDRRARWHGDLAELIDRYKGLQTDLERAVGSLA